MRGGGNSNPLNTRVWGSHDSAVKKFAFTMAELLIAMTIIAVLAVLIIPTIHDKISKKQWVLHKKALYSRMTQAIAMMPSVKSFGEYTINVDENGSSTVTDTAAMAFVTEGLSKVYKINNICNNTEFKKCGIPDKIFTYDNRDINFPKTMRDLVTDSYAKNNLINSEAVAYETANGESVVVFYNPNCVAFGKATSGSPLPTLCADFIYDLNGTAAPNRVGQDIGAFSLVLRDGSELLPVNTNQLYIPGTNNNTYVAHMPDKCREKGLRMVNYDELNALFFNSALLFQSIPSGGMVSSDFISKGSSYWHAYGLTRYGDRADLWYNNASTFCVKP